MITNKEVEYQEEQQNIHRIFNNCRKNTETFNYPCI